MKSLAAVALLGGCSLLAMHGDDPKVRCQRQAPITDTVFAAAGVALPATLYAFHGEVDHPGDGMSYLAYAIGIFTLPVAAVFAVSAIYGYVKLSDCRGE